VKIAGNSAVNLTWKASAGSITSDGVLTAPSGVTSEAYINVSACVQGTIYCDSEMIGIHPFRLTPEAPIAESGQSVQMQAVQGSSIVNATWTLDGPGSLSGTGAYTAAMLNWLWWLPDAVALIAGGIAAVLIGSLLLLPVLRTRGHYAALTTLAFGIMFGVFLDATPMVGGPQGLKLSGFNLFGWDFSNDIRLGSFSISFYANYVLLALAIFALAIFIASRLDRSWLGVWLDSVRLDEIASAVFGLNLGYWKIVAFTAGNFLAGLAGAAYAKMLGFIAPNNFTLADSLTLVSAVILGGIGNRWGALPATAILVLLPEKLQFIQEYRLLIFAALVVIILMASPAGLVPRRTRRLDPKVLF